MRVAALYDIHGNLPALEAVLESVQTEGVDQIVIGGDVFPGPMPRECLDLLLSLEIPTRFIRGNGDRAVLEHLARLSIDYVPERFREGIRWNAEQIGSKGKEAIESWPPTLEVELPPIGKVLFCHATPRNDSDIFTKETPEAAVRPAFEGVEAALVVCGHTHMQYDRMIGGTRVVNSGSVGAPHGEPGAYWLLIGDVVDFRHTPYDLKAAAERIRATGFALSDDFADGILVPRPEAEMVELFTRMGLQSNQP